MKNDPEFSLIDRIVAGERHLYAELVDRYKGYAYTIALKILRVKPEAEEAAQDAFIKAYQSLANFNRQSKFSTWLYRITFNTAISYKRKQRQPFQEIENVGIGHASESEERLDQSDKKKFIEQAMAKLSDADRTALSMFYLKEFSLEEIAEITGVQANTIKVRIHRARLRMADELKKLLNTEVLTL